MDNIDEAREEVAQHRICKVDWDLLVLADQLEIGKNTYIDEDVWLCHSNKYGISDKVKIGANCIIRSGSVIYSDVEIGDNCNFGHHVVVREGCRIGNNSSIGTGVKIECYTNIGNFVSIETQSHITGWMQIDDYVFVGGFCGSTNDLSMNWKRPGHGKGLKGPHIKRGARIGSGAILLPGIEIGEYSIINVGEVVRKNVPDNVMMFTKKGKVIYKKVENDLDV